MFNLLRATDPFTQVSSNRVLEYLHHKGEQGPRECSIPATFGRFVSDKGVLCPNQPLRPEQMVIKLQMRTHTGKDTYETLRNPPHAYVQRMVYRCYVPIDSA